MKDTISIGLLNFGEQGYRKREFLIKIGSVTISQFYSEFAANKVDAEVCQSKCDVILILINFAR